MMAKQIALPFDVPRETFVRPIVPRRAQEVHPNSRAAYREEAPKLSRRAQMIYDCIGTAAGYTDRRVAHLLGFKDMNAVRPRITEMVDAGLLMEIGTVLDQVTGKRVRVVSRSYRQRQD